MKTVITAQVRQNLAKDRPIGVLCPRETSDSSLPRTQPRL